MRENAATKARRLVSEGRLTVRHLTDDVIVADVRGDSAHLYRCGWTPAGWFCDCPSGARCSHIRALQLVVLRSRMEAKA